MTKSTLIILDSQITKTAYSFLSFVFLELVFKILKNYNIAFFFKKTSRFVAVFIVLESNIDSLMDNFPDIWRFNILP